MVWGSAAPTTEQTSDTAGDGFSKIQQGGVLLAPLTALAQGRTGSGRSYDDEASSHMESNHARSVPARFSHGRRSFPNMLFRCALKHLLSMTNNGCQNALPGALLRRSAPRASNDNSNEAVHGHLRYVVSRMSRRKCRRSKHILKAGIICIFIPRFINSIRAPGEAPAPGSDRTGNKFGAGRGPARPRGKTVTC